jgi:TIR domain
MSKKASAADRDFDVVLSFAGEDRVVAKEIAEALLRRGVRVFFDDYEKATLWGVDLYAYLSDIYQNRAHFCVMLTSRYYAKKLWTKHERRVAQARAFQDNSVYILPVRLDGTSIEGVLPTVGYLDWAKEDGNTIADAVVKKLHKLETDKAGTTFQAGPKPKTVGINIKSKTALSVMILAVVCLALTGYYFLQLKSGEMKNPAAQPTSLSNGATPTASLAVGDLPPGYQFLSFKEGDPGIPGDNLFVNSLGEEAKTVNGGTFFYQLSLKSAISIKEMKNGMTLALFLPPGVKSLEEFNNLQLDFSNLKPPTRCPYNTRGTATFRTRPVTVNNTQGLAFEISPTFLQSLGRTGDSNQPQCRVDPDDLYLTALALSSTGWNQSIPSFDAVAIAYEQGAAPTVSD